MKNFADSVDKNISRFKLDEIEFQTPPAVLYEITRVTESQIKIFLTRCLEKYIKAKIEPGKI